MTQTETVMGGEKMKWGTQREQGGCRETRRGR